MKLRNGKVIGATTPSVSVSLPVYSQQARSYLHRNIASYVKLPEHFVKMTDEINFNGEQLINNYETMKKVQVFWVGRKFIQEGFIKTVKDSVAYEYAEFRNKIIHVLFVFEFMKLPACRAILDLPRFRKIKETLNSKIRSFRIEQGAREEVRDYFLNYKEF